MQENEALLPELEVDVKEECMKFGPVDNVKVIINFTHMSLFAIIGKSQPVD